ncbi:serine hydrolase domain-containing protein [Secundilactobacillus hailunensis]
MRKRIISSFLVLFGLGVIGSAYYWHQTRNNVSEIKQQSKLPEKSRKPTATQHSSNTTDNRITRELVSHHFVGTALVVKNNHPIYQQSFGYANYAKKKLNTNQSEYQILSIQKTLTAAMIMKLIQQNRLSMKTKLSNFYPKIHNAHAIQIRNLLDMTSGLSMKKKAKTVLSESGIVRYAVKHVKSRPNKLGSWKYDAVNYVLLAGIVQRLTRQSYVNNFAKTIQQPMHLTHTGFVQDWSHNQFKTNGYRYHSKAQTRSSYFRAFKESQASISTELGTGDIYMTSSNLFKAEQQLLRGKIVSKKNIRILHRPGSFSSYGGGVYNQLNGVRLHGVGYGYESAGLLTHDGKSGVILLSNDYRPGEPILPVAQRLFNRMLS